MTEKELIFFMPYIGFGGVEKNLYLISNFLSKRIKKTILFEDIWSVSYKKGDYHTPHDHGTVGLAGILYLNMPKDGAVTQYLQPWNDWISDRTIYYPLPVKEGDIVITPKFVRHFTEPHKSKKIKRIISWDMTLQNA